MSSDGGSSRKRKHNAAGAAATDKGHGGGAAAFNNHTNHNSSIQHEVGPTFKVCVYGAGLWVAGQHTSTTSYNCEARTQTALQLRCPAHGDTTMYAGLLGKVIDALAPVTPKLYTQVPGLLVTDHTFRVPLDHSGRVPGHITVFARELVAPVNARRQQPYLLYLQGWSVSQLVCWCAACAVRALQAP